MRWDGNGWATGPVTAWPVDAAYLLLAAEAGCVVDAARLRHQARTFFGAEIELGRAKKYPEGVGPEVDAVEVDVVAARRKGPATRVRVVTVPLATAPEALAAAEAGARAIGGAGFDLLVAKARRLWQVEARPATGEDGRAPLVVAAVLASVLLAPIVPPEGGTIFGVKGARLRLEAAGWAT
jgi:hypothetical protein